MLAGSHGNIGFQLNEEQKQVMLMGVGSGISLM
jgi:hypothetical protein